MFMILENSGMWSLVCKFRTSVSATLQDLIFMGYIWKKENLKSSGVSELTFSQSSLYEESSERASTEKESILARVQSLFTSLLLLPNFSLSVS